MISKNKIKILRSLSTKKGRLLHKMILLEGKRLIKEVLSENKKDSMILAEGKEAKYKRIMDILQGQEADVKTVGLMSGQNPMVQKVSDLANANRKEGLEKAVKAMVLKNN